MSGSFKRLEARLLATFPAMRDYLDDLDAMIFADAKTSDDTVDMTAVFAIAAASGKSSIPTPAALAAGAKAMAKTSGFGTPWTSPSWMEAHVIDDPMPEPLDVEDDRIIAAMRQMRGISYTYQVVEFAFQALDAQHLGRERYAVMARVQRDSILVTLTATAHQQKIERFAGYVAARVDTKQVNRYIRKRLPHIPIRVKVG